jgi:hypothetical protein
MLVIPAYVRSAGIANTQLTYLWDEWKVRGYYDIDPLDLSDRLDDLSLRSLMALSIATGLWVCERLRLVDSDPVPVQFLEAAWAGTVSRAYCRYTETDDDQWRGPARGPLNMTISIVNDAIFHIHEDPNVAMRAVWMNSLARHVLPRTDEFDSWFDAVVLRMQRHHRKPDDDDLFSLLPPGMGNPVPPEAFDPQHPYDPTKNPSLVDAYLRGLDWQRNPFLCRPDEVAQSDELQGAPYRYTFP